MKLNQQILNDGLVKFIINSGGSIIPLNFKLDSPEFTSVMNPSIVNHEGDILVNFRVTNYSLHVSSTSRYPHFSGPIGYVRSLNDPSLESKNYLAHLNIESKSLIGLKEINIPTTETEKNLRYKGLEDARLISWMSKVYLSGTKWSLHKGTELGRINLVDINSPTKCIEIPIPKFTESKCEKNWMPILDKPFSWVRWTSPTEIVQYHQLEGHLDSYKKTSVRTEFSIRGGTQLVKVNDYYLAFAHSVDYHNMNYGKVNYDYYAHLLIFDNDLNLIFISDRFKFMNDKIEFHNGLTHYKDKLIVTFSIDDNASYALIFDPNKLLTE